MSSSHLAWLENLKLFSYSNNREWNISSITDWHIYVECWIAFPKKASWLSELWYRGPWAIDPEPCWCLSAALAIWQPLSGVTAFLTIPVSGVRDFLQNEGGNYSRIIMTIVSFPSAFGCSRNLISRLVWRSSSEKCFNTYALGRPMCHSYTQISFYHCVIHSPTLRAKGVPTFRLATVLLTEVHSRLTRTFCCFDTQAKRSEQPAETLGGFSGNYTYTVGEFTQ